MAVASPQQRQALEAEILALGGGQAAPEPGVVEMSDIIRQGATQFPGEVVVQALESAGWVVVWHTETHEPSYVHRNSLVTQLNKRLANGERAFTLIDPGQKPWRGKVKCLLHSERGERADWDDLGLPVCNKADIPNMYQLRRHMTLKHPSALKAIQDEVDEDAFKAFFKRPKAAKRGRPKKEDGETTEE